MSVQLGIIGVVSCLSGSFPFFNRGFCHIFGGPRTAIMFANAGELPEHVKDELLLTLTHEASESIVYENKSIKSLLRIISQ